MTQAYQKTFEMNSSIVKEIVKKKIQTPAKSEVDELLGDLNPRYFEEAPNLEEAKQRMQSSSIRAGSNYNFFNPY